MLITTLDILGSFAFTLSERVRAVENRMDPFGVVFLSFVAAVSGGIVRDVPIGAVPPAPLQSSINVGIAIVAGTLCYFSFGRIVRLARPVAVFDAIGLGLFCVVGPRKALDAGLSPLMASLLGMLTAVGGGIAADVLTGRPPMVLQREIYAWRSGGGSSNAGRPSGPSRRIHSPPRRRLRHESAPCGHAL
jgi:uncharacterized membrane protein YeiH